MVLLVGDCNTFFHYESGAVGSVTSQGIEIRMEASYGSWNQSECSRRSFVTFYEPMNICIGLHSEHEPAHDVACVYWTVLLYPSVPPAAYRCATHHQPTRLKLQTNPSRLQYFSKHPGAHWGWIVAHTTLIVYSSMFISCQGTCVRLGLG